MQDFVSIFLIAAAAGFSSGMFGIGGAVVSTPLLILILGMSDASAHSTPLPAAIPSAIAGSIIYARKKLIRYKIAFWALISALPCGFLGSYAASLVPDKTILVAIKASFLIVLGLRFFIYDFYYAVGKEKSSDSIPKTIVAGALAGFVAGLIAVGGGIVFVAAFRRINKMTMKQSVATSLFCVGLVAVVNSATHWASGLIDVRAALILMCGVPIFALLGAKIATVLKNEILEKSFGAAVIIFGIVFIIFKLFF